MYSIGELSRRTGISSYTIRFYEKIGLLSEPSRAPGNRRMYSEKDIRFLLFVSGLKQTGMSLGDITEFVKGGCILEQEIPQKAKVLTERSAILEKHLGTLEEQYEQLRLIIDLTKEKLETYRRLLDEEKGASHGR